MWPDCNCISRSSGELQAQGEPGQKRVMPGMPNWLTNASETYACGAKNAAAWFVPLMQDKESPGASPGESPGAAAKRRARQTSRASPSMYELDMYMYNRQPVDPKTTKELANTNSPRSPTSVI